MKRNRIGQWLSAISFAIVFFAVVWLLPGCGGGSDDGGTAARQYEGGGIKCEQIIVGDNNTASQNCTDGDGNAVSSPCSNQSYRDNSGDPSCSASQPKDSGNDNSQDNSTQNPPPS